jgi:glycosyltransferase involved in cell wall biosynthesis
MRILAVNALRLSGKRTAVGRHIEFLTREWSQKGCSFDKIMLFSSDPVTVDNLGTATPVDFHFPRVRIHRLLWEQIALSRAAQAAAVLYCPAYTCPLLYRGKIVLANHGIFEGLPKEFSWLSRVRTTPINRLSAQRADRVIANSLSTKADLMKYFGLPERKISLIYPAAHELCFQYYPPEVIATWVARIFGRITPYIIFVGKLAKRRHVPNLIHAFAKVRRELQLPHRLLIVGPNSSDIPLDELIAEAGGPEVVTYLQHVEMELLAKLYAGADAYVLPTTHEGISQTMFEAMASGTPVLSVEHPALKEGGGDAVLALPTPSVENLAKGLTTLLTNPDLRAEYSRKGRERATRFSWSNTAKETMEILDKMSG